MPFHELANIAPILLRVGTPTSSSASATLSDDSTATPPKPMRQNAGPIRALAGFKRLIRVIKYQQLMPDPFDNGLSLEMPAGEEFAIGDERVLVSAVNGLVVA